MSEESTKYLDPQQVVFLPKWARYTILSLLGILAFAACVSAVVFLFFPEHREILFRGGRVPRHNGEQRQGRANQAFRPPRRCRRR